MNMNRTPVTTNSTSRVNCASAAETVVCPRLFGLFGLATAPENRGLSRILMRYVVMLVALFGASASYAALSISAAPNPVLAGQTTTADGCASLASTTTISWSGTGCPSGGSHQKVGDWCSTAHNNTGPVTMTAVGTCTFKIHSDTCCGGADKTVVVTVNKGNQTISVGTPAPGSAVYGTSFNVAASASPSGLPVTATGSGGCSGTGTGTVAITMTSGTTPCTVTYTQAGDANYFAATNNGTTNTTTATKATQTITVTTPAPAQAAYSSSFDVAATASSGLGVAITASNGCTGSGTGAATITMNAGGGQACTVSYAQAGNANYSAAAAPAGTPSTTKVSQSITVTTPAPASAAYNSSFNVAATAISALPVTISVAGGCSITSGGSATATITMNSGTTACTVSYNQAGNANFAAAPTVSDPATSATKLSQTITFSAQTTTSRLFVLNSTFSIDPVATRGSPDSGNAISYSSLSTGVCTVAGTTVTMKSVGTCIIAANQAGNANYDAASQVTETVQLTKALQQITVTTHAPGTKVNGGTFSVAATSYAVASGSPTGLAVRIDGVGSCSGGGNSPVTLTMTSATGICTVLYTQAGDSNYEAADPVTEYVLPDTTGGSGCFGEGTYTSLQFNNTGGYIGWACNAGDYVAPGHSVSCSPPIWWNIWPIYQPGWSIQPGIGFKGHVLQTQLNPGKTFQIKKVPGSSTYYNILNTTDATCLASGNGVYESSGTRKGSNSSAGYLVAIQDSATMPGGNYCDYTADQAKWKMNISGSYATFETAGYPSWPSHGCMGSDSSLALSRRLIAPGDGNYGHWGDSWVRNLAPSCSSSGAKIKCGGYQPPPPDHVRFEFDSTKTSACGVPVTVQLCVNPAPAIGGTDSCTPFTGYSVLKPVASKGSWNGLSAAPLTGFTGTSSGITLSHTVVGDSVNLSYASASMVVADTALECYDTATNKRVSCTAAFTYTTCPPFDAVETGAATATNLYTKQAGTAFTFDVVGNAAYTGNATIDLVDVSAAGSTACSGGTALASAVFSAPSVSTGTNTYAFVGGDAGRKTFNVRYDDAAAKVAVRIVDKTSTCYSSSDTFSIRPTKLVLATSLAGSTATAGADFTLTATAKNSSNNTTTGYAGAGVLPTMDESHIYGWDGASISGLGLLSGAFADAVAGVATGTAFKFSGVGAVDFLAYDVDNHATHSDWTNGDTSSVEDRTFTTASGDAAKGDCVAGSFSATLSGGKYGCNIGSTALSLPRFIPDHYEVDNRLESSCGGIGGMTYFGQGFKTTPAARVVAMGADGAQLRNLISTYTVAHRPTFTVDAVDGATVLASPATAAPVSMALSTPFDWSALNGNGGVYENTDVNKGLVPHPNIVKPATPPNYEAFGLKTTIADPDGVKITRCNDVAVAPTTVCAPTTTPSVLPTRLRYGMLKLSNSYGSELLPLHVPVTALFWNGSSWAVNTLDSCTALAIATSAARNVAIGNYKANLTSADITITAATVTLNAGVGSIRIEAPGSGKFGSADIALNLNPATTHSDSSCVVWGGGASAPNATDGASMNYLRGAWCSNSYDKDPHARINFGTAKSPFLYMRERY